MKNRIYLAIDIGASTGKAICGVFENSRIKMREILRFSNGPIYANGSLRWDILLLWQNILNAVSECFKAGYLHLNSLGIDTWGVDFVLLDRNGQLISNPYCYRDSLTEGVEEKIRSKINENDLFRITGLRIGRVTSLAQLVCLKEKSPWVFDVARTFLMMPDFFRYCLCGKSCCEITIAGSSQLLDITDGKWSKKLFDLFSLPIEIMPEICKTGEISGTINKELRENFECKKLNIITAAGHDTASAAISVPFSDDSTLFISLGTWAVFGFISKIPCLEQEVFDAGFINEPGFDCVLVVRNMSGLYLFENLYRQTVREKNISYSEVIKMAASAKPFQSILNPDDNIFFNVGDVVQAYRKYCKKTKQKPVEELYGIFRTILEGIALNFANALRKIKRATGNNFTRISVVGGGVRNALLCQMIADATGLEVISGATEAAALGNLCTQIFAEGELSDLNEIRTIVARSCETKTYLSKTFDEWEKVYNKFYYLYE